MRRGLLRQIVYKTARCTTSGRSLAKWRDVTTNRVELDEFAAQLAHNLYTLMFLGPSFLRASCISTPQVGEPASA